MTHNSFNMRTDILDKATKLFKTYAQGFLDENEIDKFVDFGFEDSK
jgi:hypothetical protein